MQIIKEIYLDFYQTEPVLVTAKQGDNARFVKATLLDHGNLFPVPDGTTANLARDEVWNACIVNTDGTVLAPITPDMQPGRLPAEIELYLGTEKLSTWNFILVIQPSARNDSAIEGTNEYTQLDILVNQAREEISNAQTATESANAAALNANESAALANTAASNANVAASSAETNADLAMKAAISALDGKEAATSAATSANAAADRANEAAGNIEQANIKPLAYSVSGESITAGNSAEKPLIGLTVHGRADQVSTTGAQLFNKSTVTPESYVRDTDGTVVASTTHPTCASDYITLDGAESIYITSTMTSNRWGAFYNDKKEYVSGIAGYSSPITVPVGAVYIRLTVADDNLDTFMVNTGSTALPYEPYTYGVPSPSVEYPQAIDIAGLGWATGAQLWDMGDVSGTQSAKVDVSVPIPPGTYTLSADVISSDTDADTCLIYDYTNNIAIGNMARGQGKSKTFTTDKEIRSFVFYASVSNNGSVGDTFSLRNIMLNAGSSALPWEPYTGGEPGYYEKGIEVDVTGKNLFSLDNDTVFAKEICDITKKTNEITLTATGSSDTLFCQYVCYLAEGVTKYFRGKTITVSAKHKTNNSSLSPVVFINLYDSDNKVIADEKSIYFKRGSSVTVIVPKETAKIRFAFRVDQLRGQAVGNYVRMYDIQAEEGSTATSYEPYKTPQSVHLSTPNGLAGLKVSNGGNYTDESGQQWICDEVVRNERGTGKRIQRIGKSKVGDNSLSLTTASNGNKALVISNIPNKIASVRGTLFSMARVPKIVGSDGLQTGSAYENSVNFVIVGTPDDTLETLTVKYTDCEFLYVLETPVETDLSDEEIAALSALHTYSPTTTISNDAGCDMTAAYVTQYYQGVGDAMFYGVADNLTTEASGTSVLDAHQGKVLDNKIGALNDLETTAKSSAVAAINEVKSETVSLIPTVLFDSPTRVGSGTFTESIYNFERIRIYYKIRYEYGSVDIYTSFISTDGVVDLIGFFDFNNYLGAHLHRINLTDTTFSTVYAYQYFPPSTEKTDVGGDDAIAIYRVEGYRS